MRIECFPKDEYLYKIGDLSNKFYIILTGKVMLTKKYLIKNDLNSSSSNNNKNKNNSKINILNNNNINTNTHKNNINNKN